MRRLWRMVVASVTSGFCAALVCGGEPAPKDAPKPEPCEGDHTHRRAGRPQEIACYAHPSETRAYIGYQVGGGSPCHGDAPGPDDGTWGWDYRGFLVRRNVILRWWHGRRYQGGTGAYKTDGPKLHE